MTPADAKSDVERRLAHAGFNFEHPDLDIAWAVFREHLQVKVVGATDYALVDVAICDFDFQPIRPGFTVDLCHQFGFFEDCNFSHYEQLHLMLYYPVTPDLVEFRAGLFMDDGAARAPFFQEVEDSLAFKKARTLECKAALLDYWAV
jgi:hypothetical protein